MHLRDLHVTALLPLCDLGKYLSRTNVTPHPDSNNALFAPLNPQPI